MAQPEELAHEAAAVAAFLSDISGFLDEEEDHSGNRNPRLHETVDNVSTTKSKCPEDEAERRRVLRNIKTGKRRDAYRKRLKEEWQQLRCQEVTLAARLEELQQSRRRDSGNVARSAWRAIAMRQLEGRRVAEAQQEKLKVAVARRREVIRDIEGALRKRLREVEDARANGEKSSCLAKRARPEPTDERLFEAYLDELDAIYAKTDDVFGAVKTKPRLGAFLSSTPPKKRDGDTEYFENVGVLRAPFEFQRTCASLWELTKQPYRQLDREEYSGDIDRTNTTAVRFRVRCELQTGGIVSILTHFVSRRYMENDRSVIIWRELWEGEGEFEGMHSDETGWCIVRPCAGAGNLSSEATASGALDIPATLIETCVRLVPMHFGTTLSSQPDVDKFTEVLVTSGKEDNVQVERMMERLHLGDELTAVTLEEII